MSLKSYYAVASYKDKKGGFSFNEGDVIQVIQKDPSGQLSNLYVTKCYPKSIVWCLNGRVFVSKYKD